jgi:hypothetical protein
MMLGRYGDSGACRHHHQVKALAVDSPGRPGLIPAHHPHRQRLSRHIDPRRSPSVRRAKQTQVAQRPRRKTQCRHPQTQHPTLPALAPAGCGQPQHRQHRRNREQRVHSHQLRQPQKQPRQRHPQPPVGWIGTASAHRQIGRHRQQKRHQRLAQTQRRQHEHRRHQDHRPESKQLTEQAQPELTGQRRHHRRRAHIKESIGPRRRHQMFFHRQRLIRLGQGQEQRIPR